MGETVLINLQAVDQREKSKQMFQKQRMANDIQSVEDVIGPSM